MYPFKCPNWKGRRQFRLYRVHFAEGKPKLREGVRVAPGHTVRGLRRPHPAPQLTTHPLSPHLEVSVYDAQVVQVLDGI